MLTVGVIDLDPASVPGLRLPLRKGDMDISNLLYNGLPNFTSQPELQHDYAKHVTALLNIIARHQRGKHFGVHAAHRHEIIPAGTVRLEKNMSTYGATWTKATAIENLNKEETHATFFKLVKDAFVPFEFAEGPSPLARCAITPQFLSEYATYLIDNEPTDLVALEVGDFTKCDEKGFEGTAEFPRAGTPPLLAWGTLTPILRLEPIMLRLLRLRTHIKYLSTALSLLLRIYCSKS